MVRSISVAVSPGGEAVITPHQGVGKVFSILQAETSKKDTLQ